MLFRRDEVLSFYGVASSISYILSSVNVRGRLSVAERDVRKVIRVGMRSLAITIPKKWARELGLEPGSSVDMVFDGNKIVVKPQSRGEAEESNIFVEVGHNLETAIRKLIAGYIEGVTRVRVKASYSEAIELGERLREYVPLAIVVAKPGSAYHDIVFTDYNVGLRDILDKLATTVLEVLSRLEKGSLNDVDKLYQDFIKSYTLCMRVAKRRIVEGAEQPLDIVDGIVFARYLREIVEMIARDEFESFNDLDLQSISLIVDLAKTAIRSYVDNDIDTSLRLLEKASTMLMDAASKSSEHRRVFEKLKSVVLGIAELNLEKCIRSKACRCRYFYPKI